MQDDLFCPAMSMPKESKCAVNSTSKAWGARFRVLSTCAAYGLAAPLPCRFAVPAVASITNSTVESVISGALLEKHTTTALAHRARGQSPRGRHAERGSMGEKQSRENVADCFTLMICG